MSEQLAMFMTSGEIKSRYAIASVHPGDHGKDRGNMMSTRALGEQFWGPGGNMFHIAYAEHRDSIDKEGLRASPDGNTYVAEEPHPFNPEVTDLYKVNTAGLDLTPDTKLAIDRSRNAQYTPGPIPRDRIERITGDDLKAVHAAHNSLNWQNPLEGRS